MDVWETNQIAVLKEFRQLTSWENKITSCYVAETWLTLGFSFGTTLNVALPLLILAVLYKIVWYKLCSGELMSEGTSQNQRQNQVLTNSKNWLPRWWLLLWYYIQWIHISY